MTHQEWSAIRNARNQIAGVQGALKSLAECHCIGAGVSEDLVSDLHGVLQALETFDTEAAIDPEEPEDA